MSEPRPDGDSLERALRSYFAATAAVGLPPVVSAMSVRTLVRPRPRPWGMLAGVGSLAVTAALLVLLVVHLGGRGGAGGSSAVSMAGAGAEASASQNAAARAPGTVRYPGVNPGALAAAGVELLLPNRQESASVTAARAQAAALAAGSDAAARPGPAVLADVVLSRSSRRACLCWAVAVTTLRSGEKGTGPYSTVLVLIDGVTANVVAMLPVTTTP